MKRDIWLVSASGGTDLCTAFILGSPTLPVHAGELQCRGLGAAVSAFDDKGNSLVDEIGELVITQPMPSMPIYFWKDEGNVRYVNSYFDMYPKVWRHGDYLKVTSRGSCVIYGRSDSRINRGGIRIGTSEIYNALETIPQIQESLVVDISVGYDQSRVCLFVQINNDTDLDTSLVKEINRRIREAC